jgi:hypothetical protein
MNTGGLLARLKGVQRKGSGWQALCPAHEDKNPSLSIDVRDDKILVFCHAGCSQEAVLAALNLDMRDLFLETGVPEKRSVATYEYTNERGDLLYQVVRYEPKGFSTVRSACSTAFLKYWKRSLYLYVKAKRTAKQPVGLDS